MLHENTQKAYEEERVKLGKRSLAILAFMQAQNWPLTDRQIMEAMGFPDMNCVRPRVTELVKAGLLVEVCSIKCDVTGKTVRTVYQETKKRKGSI